MVTRYMLPQNDRKILMVSPEVHTTVKYYASKRGITVVEATYILLRKALLQESDINITNLGKNVH